MFIKIEVNHEDSANYHMFECDEYSITRIPKDQAVELMIGYREIFTEHPLTSDRSVMYLDRTKQIFLQGCTIYIMNDEGKTVDVIYA